jgi:hypothetical protein
VTELERARQHLSAAQVSLRYARRLKLSYSARRGTEAHFLAALSWVWDAQQRSAPGAVTAFGEVPIWLGWDLAKEAGGGSYSSPLS